MAAAPKKKSVRVDITTGIGVLSFCRVHPDTAGKKTDNAGNPTGEKSFDIQILLPKSDREGARALLKAIKEVGEAEFGENWKSVRMPLRDGDKEANQLTSDPNVTKGEKYPERAGHYFINARSTKPVGVYDREQRPITDSSLIYGGCKGRLALTFYPYNTQGNTGIAAGLSGVQKTADGEPIAGGGVPSVESMFSMLEAEPDDDLESLAAGDEAEPEPTPPAKPAAKKAAAKKAAAPAPAAEPEPAGEVDDLDDVLGGDNDESDADSMFADLGDDDS